MLGEQPMLLCKGRPRPNQRLSRKRSNMSLDRLRRSMSLETCKSDTSSARSVDLLMERQTSSVKSRTSINPPETIPEEEIERIRRESLIPKTNSSCVDLDLGNQQSSHVVSKTIIDINQIKPDPTVSENATTKADVTPCHFSSSNDKGNGNDMLYSQRRDEGLGESFDRYSEMSDSASRLCGGTSGGGGNNTTNGLGGGSGGVIELHTLQSVTPIPSNGSSGIPGKMATSVLSTKSATDSPKSANTAYGTDVDEDSDALEGVTFTMKQMTDEESDGEGIDPLSFLSEYAAKRVTFM